MRKNCHLTLPKKGQHHILKSPQYQNCQVLNPEGQLMFRCSYKKAVWYLDRNLGVKLGDEPLIIKLSFVPKGNGHADDPYHLQEMENKCVVCGSCEDLTRHHIIPYCYRKFFLDEIKNHKSYDIMSMCTYCHHKYELVADILKKEIGEEYDMPVHGVGIKYDEKLAKVKSAAFAILNHGHKMPVDRLNELYKRISDYLGREANQEDLDSLIIKETHDFKEYVHHGKYVVSKIPSGQIEPFIKKWRQHFIDTMLPKFLPKNWSVDRPMLYKP